MAYAAIVYRFADGDELRCGVTVKSNYPDAVDEARTQTTAMFREALGVSVEALATSETDADEPPRLR